MDWRRGSQTWQRTARPEVGLVFAKWTAAKGGAMGSFWQPAPRRLGRYLDELSSANTHALTEKI